MLERAAAKKKAGPPKPRLHRTNLTIAFVHQAILAAVGEVGGPHECRARRAVFHVSQDGPPGPTSPDGFARDVACPVIKEIFRAILKQLGPKTPHVGDIDTWTWP